MSDEYVYFNNEEELKAYQSAKAGKPYGRKVMEELFPGVRVTSDYRDPNHPLSKKNPNSYHKTTDRAVDIEAIPGMTFEDVAKKIRDAGYDITEMQDEYTNPSKNATGKHWHFVLGDKYEYFNSEEEAKAALAKRGQEMPQNTPEKPVQRVPEYQPLQTAGTEKTITTGAETAQQQDIEQALRQGAKAKIPFEDLAKEIETSYPGQIAKEGRNLKWYYDHYRQGGNSPINWTADPNRAAENEDPNTITVTGDKGDVAPYQEELTYLKDRALLAASQGTPAAAYRGIRRALGDTGEQVNQDKADYEAELQAQIDASNAFGNTISKDIAGFGAEAIGGVGFEDLVPVLGGATRAGRVGGAVVSNMLADAGLQGIEIAQGSQDAFSPERNLISGVLGGALQGGGELLHSLAKKYEGTGVGVTEKSGKVVEVSDSAAPSAAPTVKGRTKAGSTKDQKVRAVSDEVARVTEGWTNAPNIVVYTNFGALQRAEPALAKGMVSDGAAKAPGFYGEDGTVHIIADNVAPEKVQSLIFHEALGHDGLAKEFGDELADKMGMVYDRNWSTRREAGNLAMKGYGEAYASTPQSKAAVKAAMKLTNAGERRRAIEAAIEADPRMKSLLAEEVLAKTSERGPVNKKIFDTVANTIRAYARKMGLKLDLSNREVRAILAEAHARVISGEPSVASATGQKYILTTHVSPHDFTNVDEENPFGKFDSSKMGTGEGAQVYSWGHYTGEQTRDVYMAKFSRDIGDAYLVDGQPLRDKLYEYFEQDWSADSSLNYKAVSSIESALDWYARKGKDDYKDVYQFIQSEINNNIDAIDDLRVREATAVGNDETKRLRNLRAEAEYRLDGFKFLQTQLVEENLKAKPKTYEVDAPDEITSRMLLWDETLDKQPEGVKKAVKEDLPGTHVTREEMADLKDQLAQADDAAREYYEKHLQPIYDEAQARGEKLFEEEMARVTSSEEALQKAIETFTNKYPGRKEQAGRLARGLNGGFNGITDNFVKDLEDLVWRIVDRKIGAWVNTNIRAPKNEYLKFAKVYDDIKEKIDNARYLTGEGIYEEFVKLKGSPKAASLYLASKGIPGNKYKDGFTRHRSGEASYNYVWWNDEGPDAPKIINKYSLSDSELTQKTVDKFMKAMKGARRLTEDRAARVTADRKAKMKDVGAVRQKTSGKAGLFAELNALKGETVKSYLEPLGGKFSQRETKALFDAFKNAPNLTWFQSIRARQGLLKLMEGELPSPSDLDLMGRVLGRDFIRYALDLRGQGTKMKDFVQNAAGLQRAMISSIDLSGPFRQGYGLMGRKAFWKNLAPMIKQGFSKDFHNQVMLSIEEHPYYDLSQKAGLFIAEMGSDLNAREEHYSSTWADKVPGVVHSNNAYTGFLNKVRFDTFVDIVEKYKDFKDPNLRIDFTDEANLPALKQLAKHLTVFTGRGSLGKRFESAAPFLSMLFFSPRLMASRVNMLLNGVNPFYWGRLHPVARREVAQDYAKMVGIASMAIGLVKFAFADDENVDVELDMRSSDFGKIRIGERRYDILGGLGQYMVLGARLLPALAENVFGLGQAKTKTAKGELVRMKGEGRTGYDIALKFFRNKLAPIPGYVATASKGENPIGDEYEPAKDAGSLFVPLFLQDLYKGFEDEGLPGAAAALPSLFGFGYSKYAAVPSKYDAYGRTFAESKKKDPVVEELDQLQEEENLSMPLVELATNTNLPKPFRNLEDPKPLEMFQELSGKYIMENLRELTSTEEWKTMTNEEKIDSVRKVKKTARKQARDELFGEVE